MPPLPHNITGDFLHAFFASHYVYAVAACQVIGGLFLILGRFVPLGLTILGPVIVNIVLFHVFLAAEGLPLAARHRGSFRFPALALLGRLRRNPAAITATRYRLSETHQTRPAHSRARATVHCPPIAKEVIASHKIGGDSADQFSGMQETDPVPGIGLGAGRRRRAATFESTKIGACAVPAISDFLQRVRLKISPTPPL
jgi:hypothetical protein